MLSASVFPGVGLGVVHEEERLDAVLRGLERVRNQHTMPRSLQIFTSPGNNIIFYSSLQHDLEFISLEIVK